MDAISDISHRWTDENARLLYEAYSKQLREVLHKRAVDLGVSMDDGDEQTATALLKQNRRLRMSERHRAEVWESWQPIVDGLTRKMADIFGTYTVPVIIMKKSD